MCYLLLYTLLGAFERDGSILGFAVLLSVIEIITLIAHHEFWCSNFATYRHEFHNIYWKLLLHMTSLLVPLLFETCDKLLFSCPYFLYL